MRKRSLSAVEHLADLTLRVLLDQNIPEVVGPWLRQRRPAWLVRHTSELDLDSRPDWEIFQYAQDHGFLIITFDEDFADRRGFAVSRHHGIVRLRIWPTTIEETQVALERLLEAAPVDEWRGALIIVDRLKIRLRRYH